MEFEDTTPDGIAARKARRLWAIAVVSLVAATLVAAGTWAVNADRSAEGALSMDACRAMAGATEGKAQGKDTVYLCTNPGLFATAK
jgi:hypothetical protein